MDTPGDIENVAAAADKPSLADMLWAPPEAVGMVTLTRKSPTPSLVVKIISVLSKVTRIAALLVYPLPVTTTLVPTAPDDGETFTERAIVIVVDVVRVPS